MSWLKVRLARSFPPQTWKETPEEGATRLRCFCAEVNAKLDVVGLCKTFPKRLAKLLENSGGRLSE